MKLWIARFVFDNGYCYHQYELIISAASSAQARHLVYEWERKNCKGDECVDYRTLTVDEIIITDSSVLKVFDRGVI